MQIEAIWCLTQAYMTDRSKYSKTPPLSYIPYITLDRYHIHGIRFTFKMPWWWNGRHARLKISCWRAWRFESSSRHNIEISYWIGISLAANHEILVIFSIEWMGNLFWNRPPCTLPEEYMLQQKSHRGRFDTIKTSGKIPTRNPAGG